jgi:hypothetical protein
VASSRLLPLALLLAYGIGFGTLAFGVALPAFDDHPGQVYRLWHVLAHGPAPWAWNPGWWTGYPELQFYPPGFFYLGLALHWISLGTLSTGVIYQILLWLTWLAPGVTVYALLLRIAGDGWLALPGALVALTLSAGVTSGVEGGVHVGMLPARLGWALLPLLALALVRWVEDEASRPWGPALIVMAAIALTHPAHGPAAATLVVIVALSAPGSRTRRTVDGAVLLVGAAALTSFWTFPLLARLEHTRPLAWGSLTLGEVGSRLVWHPLLPLIALFALPLTSRPRLMVRILQRWPWAMAAVVLVDAAVLEPLGLRWLPADRIVDGMWLAFIVAAAGNLAAFVRTRSQRAFAATLIATLVGVVALGAVDRTLALWPVAADWPSYAATARGLRLDALWAAVRKAPPGRVLFVRSGVPLRFGDEWWRPHAHVTALAPLHAGRDIVNGTFTHPSPVAALVYRGSPERGAITALVERLDGHSLFGRSLDALDAATLNAFTDRLGVSTVIAVDEDGPKLRAFIDNPDFPRRLAIGPFLIFERRAGAAVPTQLSDRRWTFAADGKSGDWVSTHIGYYPLWHAERSGRPLRSRRGLAWDLEVQLDDGRGPIELTYSPAWVERGAMLMSAATAFAWLAWRWRASTSPLGARATSPSARSPSSTTS